MATTCFGQPGPEDSELATFVVSEADVPATGQPAVQPQASSEAPAESAGQAPVATPVAGLASAAPAPSPSELPRLALKQMTPKIADGLLMVFGPQGDPVPPSAFAEAAAARPDARLRLPDGTTAAACRIAAVLRAQTLGRLGAAERSTDWILTMLREGDQPEAASEEALRAEQAGCVVRTVGKQLLVDVDAGAFRIVDVATEVAADGALGLFLSDGAPTSVTDLAALLRAGRARPADATDGPASDDVVLRACTIELRVDSLWIGMPDFAAHGGGVQLARWTTSAPNGPVVAVVLSDDSAARLVDLFALLAKIEQPDCRADRDHAPDEPAPLASAEAHPSEASLPGGDDGPRSAAPTAEARQGDAGQAEVDPERIVLVVIRGVPDNARLSTGIRDEDGSWSISPLDLANVTISLASDGAAVDARSVGGDLNITGIALTEDGDLVAVSETVPIADYLAGPGPGGPTEMREVEAASDAVIAPEPRMIPLEVDPRAWAGKPFDALVIRDLPAGGRLSAGAYDPAIDGWVLMPQDLSALAILPPPDQRANFTLTLMGIALRPDDADADAARVLARLPVTLT